LMKEKGYSRDRAINFLLRELGGVGVPNENEFNRVKQQYRLAHQQAARAIAVSSALRKAVSQNNCVSRTYGVRQLTEKLEKATFATNIDENLSDSTTSTRNKKVSEILLPQIPKTRPKISSPVQKRTKTSIVSTNSKSSKSKPRKRSIEEIGTTQQSATAENTDSRLRSDSVTEAVSAKLNQPAATTEAKPTPSNNTARSKRTRGSSSLEDDACASAKRARSSA